VEKRNYKKGDLICRENTSGEEMFIILSGSVKVYKKINQERIDLAVLGKDDFFGELCLLLGCPRTATVEALEASQLLIIKKETLLKNIQEDPKLALRMLTRMAKRIRESNNLVTRLEGEVSSLKIIYSVS
jgi:CRP/FNR family cyclic AMP-dependent transcriptional regulator